MFGGILTHRTSCAVGSLAALSTPLESNDITSISIMQQCLGTRNQCKVVPICRRRQNDIIWIYHFTGINWLQMWGNIHDNKHSPNICLLVMKHPKILIFIQQISSDLNICPNTVPLTLLQLTIRMLRTESFFLDPYNITNLNTLC